jgi:hypothetical protein
VYAELAQVAAQRVGVTREVETGDGVIGHGAPALVEHAEMADQPFQPTPVPGGRHNCVGRDARSVGKLDAFALEGAREDPAGDSWLDQILGAANARGPVPCASIQLRQEEMSIG